MHRCRALVLTGTVGLVKPGGVERHTSSAGCTCGCKRVPINTDHRGPLAAPAHGLSRASASRIPSKLRRGCAAQAHGVKVPVSASEHAPASGCKTERRLCTTGVTLRVPQSRWHVVIGSIPRRRAAAFHASTGGPHTRPRIFFSRHQRMCHWRSVLVMMASLSPALPPSALAVSSSRSSLPQTTRPRVAKESSWR